MERFMKEIKELKDGKEVSKQSHLNLLTPIMDELTRRVARRRVT